MAKKVSTKAYIKKLFLLPVLIAALGLLLTGSVTAQTFTPLHEFTAIDQNYFTNSDGAGSQAGLIVWSNTLYGTASGGGDWGGGNVFAINSNGSGFTNLYSFRNDSSEGSEPAAALVLSGNTLYGTTVFGASYPNDGGMVFRLNTDGTGFTNLYSFTDFNNAIYANSDGGIPVAPLILSGNTLYGTASVGGIAGLGTVFAINTDGTSFTNLHSFTAYAGYLTNYDGAGPKAGLVLSGNTLYGTAQNGGSRGYGTVFALTTNGMGFTTLHNFTNLPDGADPFGGLVLSGKTLYGTTAYGGHSGVGIVFAVNTDGMGFTNLHSFAATSYDYSTGLDTNTDGAYPLAGLSLVGNTLYGTASGGGISGEGTVFTLNTNGSGFTTLYSFTEIDQNYGTNSDGTGPNGLILSGNTLYGTAGRGGISGNGTVFSLSVGTAASQPQLTINLSGTNVILTWLAAGFILQSATNLVSPVWMTIPGQNTVTNPISGIQKFYRLSQ
jgi:uncharacterized repeat protein (TIGR03803 family)